ncbi:hypothetical protein FMV2238Y02_11920 [Streptococcus canis]|uniref:Uncharacterized protein n=1 Tax=Streptococcus canis TaxID=1329 RepID=A0A3P5Y2V8_STRCB|nr:hypothetical protein FMV2238Y02_11920 [Streptococcus canis]
MYQKYAFNIKDSNIISNYESFVRNLTINREKLDTKDKTVSIGDEKLPS